MLLNAQLRSVPNSFEVLSFAEEAGPTSKHGSLPARVDVTRGTRAIVLYLKLKASSEISRRSAGIDTLDTLDIEMPKMMYRYRYKMI